MKLTVTIDDAYAEGVTAAREAYNVSNAGNPDFAPLTTDTQYVQFVLNSAAESWTVQHGKPLPLEQQLLLKAERDALAVENAELRGKA